MKWTTNVNILEIRSHKNLITAVWANEVHRLLTYCSTSCYQMRRWWHVRVSAVERTSTSAREAIELLECETSDFISPDLWSPPTAVTSIRSITSSEVMQQRVLSDDVQECGWTQKRLDWLKSGLVWSRTLLTLLSTHGETVCVLVFAQKFYASTHLYGYDQSLQVHRLTSQYILHITRWPALAASAVSDWVQDRTDHIQGADNATATVPVRTHPLLRSS